MSRLIQLLLEANVLGRAQAEEARQQQIVYGDRIGTNLLACRFVRETLLAQALGALHGVPYAAGKDADTRPAFTRGIHRSMAEALRAVPVRVDENVAWIYMTDPGDQDALVQLEAHLLRPVRPVVVCEARMWWLLHKFYLVRKGTRLLALDDESRGVRHRILPRSQTRTASIYAGSADEMTDPHQQLAAESSAAQLDDPTAPVGVVSPLSWLSSLPASPAGALSAPSVLSSNPVNPLPSASGPTTSSLAMTSQTGAPIVSETTAPRGMMSPPQSTSGGAIAMSSMHAYAANTLGQRASAFDNEGAELLEELAPVEEAPPLVQGVLVPQRDTSPLSFHDAKQLLAGARDRDEIALIVLRSCLSTFTRAILLTVQQDFALGWDAVGDGIDKVDVKAIWLPLKQPSIFKLARDSQAHFLGPLPKEKVNILFLKLTGAQIPKSALVVPVLVKGRVVNLLYCDNGKGQHVSTDIGEMLVVAQHINRSYESLLRR